MVAADLVVDEYARHLELEDPDPYCGPVLPAHALRGVGQEVGDHGLARLARARQHNLHLVHRGRGHGGMCGSWGQVVSGIE